MRTLLAAAALTALVPGAALAQDTQTEDRRVVVVGGPGHRMEIPEGGLTRDAFLARHTDMFARLDADGDGTVTRDEMDAMAEAHGADGPVMIRRHGPGGPGGEHDVVIVRRGPDGEEITVEGMAGGSREWTSEDGQRRVIIREHGGPDGPIFVGGPGDGEGERHVFVFQHDGEPGLDADGDGRWTFEEMTAPMREHFNQLDANHDGFVDAGEREH